MIKHLHILTGQMKRVTIFSKTSYTLIPVILNNSDTNVRLNSALEYYAVILSLSEGSYPPTTRPFTIVQDDNNATPLYDNNIMTLRC